MNIPWSALLGLVVLVPLLAGCAGARRGREGADSPVLVGVLERAEIETAMPTWIGPAPEAVDRRAAARLAAVPAGGDVTVFLGTWCGDSRREVTRLWRALDLAGEAVPFRIEYVGVDREKIEPADHTAGRDIRYVPTFIVSRDGEEVGRIVESAPCGVESDLADLLTGARTGAVSGRPDWVVPEEEHSDRPGCEGRASAAETATDRP